MQRVVAGMQLQSGVGVAALDRYFSSLAIVLAKFEHGPFSVARRLTGGPEVSFWWGHVRCVFEIWTVAVVLAVGVLLVVVCRRCDVVPSQHYFVLGFGCLLAFKI
jgi:hypothetical protein